MKILHLTTHLNVGGIARYIETLGGAMVRNGHQVVCLSSGGDLVTDFEHKGISTVRFPIRTKSELSPKLYRSLPEILRFVRSERFHILHAHTRVTQVLANWISKLAKIPYVTTCHGFYKRRLGRRLFPSWGERVIGISPLVAEELHRTHKVPKEKIELVMNALDVSDIRRRYASHNPDEVRRILRIKQGATVLTSVARLVTDKGIEYLIQSAGKLREEDFDIHALIVGDGPERERLFRLAEQLGIGKYVTFTGHVKDISFPLAATDIFVLPAVWREGFGLSIGEAMAVGKPVVVTNIWALNMLVENGVNGFLVEPRDVSGLCSCLERLINDPLLRAKVGANGFKMAEDRFSMERMAQAVQAVYESVLEEKGLLHTNRQPLENFIS